MKQRSFIKILPNAAPVCVCIQSRCARLFFFFFVSALHNDTLAALQRKVAATVRTQARNEKGPWQGEKKGPEKSQRAKE